MTLTTLDHHDGSQLGKHTGSAAYTLARERGVGGLTRAERRSPLSASADGMRACLPAEFDINTIQI